ncbi:unnamed protein product [Echinostoma caproni]|uniref:Uncharacterized protein n=1 Tax=Echinostoma caproni TaxID=27848 RepID=A0A183ASB4_9TREM|nr:unnamed protein product [Echinostoma caproni]
MAALQPATPPLDPSSSLELCRLPLLTSDSSFLCDVSHQVPRPLVPEPMRRLVFDALQGLSHPGVRATQKLISQRSHWAIDAAKIKVQAGELEWFPSLENDTPALETIDEPKVLQQQGSQIQIQVSNFITLKRATFDIPPLKINGARAETDVTKAEAFAQHYASTYTTDTSPSPRLSCSATLLSWQAISVDEVRDALSALKAYKSLGPDGLHPIVLKELALIFALTFAVLFGKSLPEGRLPADWKSAVPVVAGNGTTPITTVELPGSRSTVGITNSQVQEPGRPLAKA